MKLGFVGAGAMGAPMIRNLLAAGHDVAVMTRSRASAGPVLAGGATWAPSVEHLCDGITLLFGALPGPAEVEALVAQLPGHLPAGATYVDFTTNAPSVVRHLRAVLAAHGIDMLDAPVSGGPKGAASGKLAIWVSGRQDAFDRVKPVLDTIGDQVRFLGASGNASVAKLVHNVANYGIQTVLAEAITMGVRAGVDPVELWAAIRQGSLGRQRAVDRLADQFLPGEFDTPAFALALAHKDVRLATELAHEVGVPMRLAELTYADMTEALARGWGARDSRAPMLLQEERAGVDIKVDRAILRQILTSEPL